MGKQGELRPISLYTSLCQSLFVTRSVAAYVQVEPHPFVVMPMNDWEIAAELRCALLHQGRTLPERGRYRSYSFVQPVVSGEVAHQWVTGDERNMTLALFCGSLARVAIQQGLVRLPPTTAPTAAPGC
jgi:hypothetical protein